MHSVHTVEYRGKLEYASYGRVSSGTSLLLSTERNGTVSCSMLVCTILAAYLAASLVNMEHQPGVQWNTISCALSTYLYQLSNTIFQLRVTVSSPYYLSSHELKTKIPENRPFFRFPDQRTAKSSFTKSCHLSSPEFPRTAARKIKKKKTSRVTTHTEGVSITFCLPHGIL